VEYIGNSEVFEDVKIFKGLKHVDNRGTFIKPFYGNNLEDQISIKEILTVTSKKNVVRGLHFQYPPKDVKKLITCIDGKVKDVFVDLRKDSLTYGYFDSICLDAEINYSVLIPEGFAHGYSVLSETATVLYLQSGHYDEKYDNGINLESLDINWGVENKIISEKDKELQSFKNFNSPWQ
tara:strand:+ start:24506 stop:25042 length:537 start_codon:yes stop_codon:yes gene_type:complete